MMMMAVRDRAISMGAVLEDDNDGNGDRQSDQPENCCARRGGVGQRWLMRRGGGDKTTRWGVTIGHYQDFQANLEAGNLAPIDQIPEKTFR